MFDDVVTLLADRLSTRFLTARVTDGNPSTLRTSTILAAPASVTALAEALDDPARSSMTIELLRSALPVGLPPSATLADMWQDPFAAESATTMLFGEGRERVVSAIADETGVSAQAAGEVVVLSVLAVFATVAKQFGQADQYTIAAALDEERHEMSARGWDLWLDTVMGISPPESSWPAGTPSPTQTAELALPRLAGEPASTDTSEPAVNGQSSTSPTPPQVPSNGSAPNAVEPPILPAPTANPSHPTMPELPAAHEASGDPVGQAELPSGAESTDRSGNTDSPALADRPGAPELPLGLLPNQSSGPPSLLSPETDFDRPSPPPPDRRPTPTPAPRSEEPLPQVDSPRAPITQDVMPQRVTPQSAMPQNVMPDGPVAESSKSAVPAPERDLAPVGTTYGDYADVPAPMSASAVPNLERPSQSNSSRGDEVVRLMGGALLVLGILLAIGLLQWWRGNNETTTETSGTTEQAAIADEDSGGDDSGSGAGSTDDSTDAAADDVASPTTVPAAEEDYDDGSPSEPALLRRELSIPMDDPLQRAEATGVADVVLDAEAEEVCWAVETSGIGSPYDGHIHVGPAGVKGGIVVDFGPVENGEPNCIDVAMNDIQAIIADPSNYYVEMHDPSGDFTIRAQLGDDPMTPPPPGAMDFDPTGNGATTKISAGQILLEGPVPDQETMDRLVFEVSGLDESKILVVNDLVIDETADPPTGLITVADGILFGVDSAELEADSTVLEDLALLFTARPDWIMTITGHTDAAGDGVYNLELSLDRASAVRDALAELGVEAERLRTVGAGSTSPVASNDTEEGRQLNRRIEFRVDRN